MSKQYYYDGNDSLTTRNFDERTNEFNENKKDLKKGKTFFPVKSDIKIMTSIGGIQLEMVKIKLQNSMFTNPVWVILELLLKNSKTLNGESATEELKKFYEPNTEKLDDMSSKKDIKGTGGKKRKFKKSKKMKSKRRKTRRKRTKRRKH